MKSVFNLITVLSMSFYFSGCVYNNEELLYEDDLSGNCDTKSISYSETIKPIITANCYSCHSVNNADSFGSGIDLETYNNLIITISNGTFIGTITHSPGYKPMPLGGEQLNDCSIEKINTWVNSGAVNN
ncbi:MAG: hypothetical protein ABFR62_04180 [Bacteroidota bacterium]